MVKHKYNKPYYEIEFSNLDKEGIHVLSFEGEEKLSGLYEYKIDLISDDPELDSSKVLNKPVTFILNRGDEDPINIHGIVSKFEQYGKTTDYVFYRIELVPKVWRLNLVFQNEVYQNMDIKDVINKVMKDGGYQSSDYKIDLKNSYPVIEYIVQYRETSMNFLNRRLENYGIFYYFDHSGDEEVVVFTDVNNKLPQIKADDPIAYNQNRDPLSEKDSITEITCREKVVTGMVQLKDYNYMTPEKQLMAQSQIDSDQPGLYYDYGSNFSDEKEGEFLAKVRNQEFLCDKKIFYGKSDCRLFKTGYRFKVDKHYRKDWNSEYILTKLKSKGTQENLFAFLPSPNKIIPTYQNEFEAIPFDIDFRPKREAAIPKINGIMSAKLESSSNDDYAYIDNHGRYKFKALFDLSDKTDGEASLPIRLSQGYTGPGYGIHFPNHAGTEVIWACVDGNVDKPVGLGTIPNPSNASPVNSNNHTQSMIRTAGGNEIKIEDESKSHLIKLSTPHKNTTIRIGASKSSGKPGIEMKTDGHEYTKVGGHRIHYNKGNMEVTIDGHQYTVVDGNVTYEFHSNSHKVVKGNQTEEIRGNKTSKTIGNTTEEFYGTKNSTSIAAVIEKNLSAKTSWTAGVEHSTFVGAKIDFTLSKHVEKNLAEVLFKEQKRLVKITSEHKEEVGSYQLNATTDVKIEGGTTIEIERSGNKITISGGNITIKAPKIKLDGDVDITGKLDGGGVMKNPNITSQS